MATPTRRSFLLNSGCLLVGAILAGCTNRGSGTDERTTQEPTSSNAEQTSAETETTTGQTPTSANMATESSTSTPQESKDSVKIWEVAANPEGQDSKHLNDELITLEVRGTNQINAVGYSLEYSTGQAYTFPKIMSELQPDSTIRIHSGAGENSIPTSSSPQYDLFVGSASPLLNNDGGTVVLKDSSGTIVQKVSYPALNEGVPYGVPTPPVTFTPQDDNTPSLTTKTTNDTS